jgi:addiction module HigA family antidote
MSVPGWGLHPLISNLTGHYSVAVNNGNWRMTFTFEGEDAVLVDYQDYHQMTRIYNPPHPGETLREDVLPALGLTITEAATQLNVTRAALSRVLNGRAAISPEMALRLEGCWAWRTADRLTYGWRNRPPMICGRRGKPARHRYGALIYRPPH